MRRVRRSGRRHRRMPRQQRRPKSRLGSTRRDAKRLATSASSPLHCATDVADGGCTRGAWAVDRPEFGRTTEESCPRHGVGGSRPVPLDDVRKRSLQREGGCNALRPTARGETSPGESSKDSFEPRGSVFRSSCRDPGRAETREELNRRCRNQQGVEITQETLPAFAFSALTYCDDVYPR